MTEIPALAASDLRVVLLTTTGPCAGLHRIEGLANDFKAVNGGILPVLVEGVTFPGGHTGLAGFIGVKCRYVLYKEVSGPQSSRFGQQTGKDHFNPEQR